MTSTTGTSYQSYNPHIVLQCSDEGCQTNQVNNCQDFFKEKAFDACVFRAIAFVSRKLQAKFSSVLENTVTNRSSIITIPLKKSSFVWKKTGGYDGCIFAIKNQKDGLHTLELVQSLLNSRKYRFADGDYSVQDVVNIAMDDILPGDQTSIYNKAISHLEKKIDTAFKEVFSAEAVVLNKLTKIQETALSTSKSSTELVNDIKTKIKHLAFCEYFYYYEPLFLTSVW